MSKKVLVIEDEEIMRELLNDILKSHGYESIFANDGESGIKEFLANEKELSLVISDIVMPRLDGVSAYLQMRQRKPDLKVIFMTGYSESEEVKSLKKDSNVRYLEKPFKAESIESQMKSLGVADAVS